MKMYQFSSSARRLLSIIPLIVRLFTGITLLVATPLSMAATATPSATSIVDIGVSGTVTGSPEDVVFNHVKVEIGSTLVLTGDPDNPSKLALDITFLNKPVGLGVTTKGVYFASFQTHILRSFAGNQVLGYTFPFLLNKAPLYDALSGYLTLNLTFDTNGVITGAEGKISATPVF